MTKRCKCGLQFPDWLEGLAHLDEIQNNFLAGLVDTAEVARHTIGQIGEDWIPTND